MSNLFIIITSTGLIQSILFALLVATKKKKELSDKILLFWFLMFAAHLLLAIGKTVYVNSFILTLIMTIGFLQGPLFFLYTKALFGYKFSRFDIFHFIPFFVFTSISFFIKESFWQSWEVIILFCKITSLVSYPSYILYVYENQLTQLKNNSADSNISKLHWIKIIAILFLISLSVSIIRFSIELSVGVSYFQIWDVLRYVILITALGFYGLKYGMVYKMQESKSMTSKNIKYKHSPLKKEQIYSYRKIIDTFFEENSTYLLSDFSLKTLSETIKIPKHQLSQIINSEMKTTFYDMVNAKRIEYAIKKLSTPSKLDITLEGLGYECGFSSKSAFFRHFKKYTGKTPGQFKKEISTS